jgi:AraC-like DNA-binding protein
MINMYDFITSNASYFDQLKFGREGDIFIDYLCPITDTKSRIWSHKNCLMYVMQGVKEYASLAHYHKPREGEVLFIRKGGYILFQHFEKPYRALIFMFDDDAVRNLVLEYPELLKKEQHTRNAFLNESEILTLGSSAFIESIFLSCLMYVQDPAEKSPISLELKFKELLVNLLRKREDNAFYLHLSWLTLDDEVSFIKLMKDNSHLNFTSEELARAAGMTLSTFKRTFKKYFKLPPGKWLYEQRIARAKHMLKSPNTTISDIAFELGYNDVAAFSKAFKGKTGMRPGEFIKTG